MARRKQSTRAAKAATPASQGPADVEQISYSTQPLHELFGQQTRQLLDRSDLDEEQKQNILLAMSCPCCGAGAMSYTVKLKRPG
jgi:hypothetical protein